MIDLKKISNSKNKQKNKNSKRSNNNKEELYDNHLSSKGLFIDKNNTNSKILEIGKKNIKDSLSQSSLLIEAEHESLEKKKQKLVKFIEKRYIVDDIDNIFVLLKEPKLKLRIQEILHYFIVFLTCIYYWIFLFLTGIKYERNYYLTEYEQFEAYSDEQICDFPENSANTIIYNSSFNYYNLSSDEEKFFEEESNTVNRFYRPYFIRYLNLIYQKKLTTTTQPNYIIDKPLLSIIITNKEKWNLFYRYFSLCEFDNYYFIMVSVLAIGGSLGSIFFGFLSDIFGRRLIILLTLLISTIGTFGIYFLCFLLDNYYEDELHKFQKKCLSELISCEYDILPDLYAQGKTNQKFKNLYIYFLFCIFLLNFALWPLLKSCMALLVENSKGELEVLINFRRYNLVFQGLPPICTSLLFVNLNNITLTFLILSIVDLGTLILSFLFLDESIRYYYEYSDWENLTKVLLNTYQINLSEFRTLNEKEFKDLKKKEKAKSFNRINSYVYNSIKNKSYYVMNQTYYKHLVESSSALKRNIKRHVDFIIKLEDVKYHPWLIVTSLWANHALKNSKTLLLIILILLYIVMDLFQKELLEPPFFSTKDLYFGLEFNYVVNSILFIYLVVNIFSNYFYYCFYRIECFKTVIYISQLVITVNLIVYHIIITYERDIPMNMNEYNLSMLTSFIRDNRPYLTLILLFIVYFALNGVIFYVYLLILKISKTIHRCSFFSLHSVALIVATVISEFIYYYCEDYFLFLGILNFLCLINFAFLSEFSELLYIMNDLKVNNFGIKNNNWKEKFKSN